MVFQSVSLFSSCVGACTRSRMVYTGFVDFMGGADGWTAHEVRHHVYSRKLHSLEGVIEGGMFGGGVGKDGVQGIGRGLTHCLGSFKL